MRVRMRVLVIRYKKTCVGKECGTRTSMQIRNYGAPVDYFLKASYARQACEQGYHIGLDLRVNIDKSTKNADYVKKLMENLIKKLDDTRDIITIIKILGDVIKELTVLDPEKVSIEIKARQVDGGKPSIELYAVWYA